MLRVFDHLIKQKYLLIVFIFGLDWEYTFSGSRILWFTVKYWLAYVAFKVYFSDLPEHNHDISWLVRNRWNEMFIFLFKNNTLIYILKVNRTLTLMESCIIGTHITTSYIYLHSSVVCFCRCTRRIDNKNTTNLTVLPHKTLQVIILQSERRKIQYFKENIICMVASKTFAAGRLLFI